MISMNKRGVGLSALGLALAASAGTAMGGIDGGSIQIGIVIAGGNTDGTDYIWNQSISGDFLDDNTFVARFDFADAASMGLDTSLFDLDGNGSDEFVEYRVEGTNLRSTGGAQTVNLGFNVAAGFLNTAFSIDATDLAFAPINSVTGSASAAVSLTSTNFGVDATLSPDAGGAYSAKYNGGSIFSDLFTSALTSPSFSTTPYSDSASGPIAGSVTDIDAQWNFTLSALDLASGTSTFTVVPAPASVAVLGLGGLVAVRRRR
ncbi:MAG: hypothetical protein DHS20C14_16620 [Phycisphaeraceae bacterium]|nr:MAG: hypothetical protein DHS20C14_16620 [Phycisphaeraceae bacterium]